MLSLGFDDAPPPPVPLVQTPGHTLGLVGEFYVRGTKISRGTVDAFSAVVNNLSSRLCNPTANVLLRPILSPEEWLADSYYSGPIARDWWPQKRRDFLACARGDITEIILTGAIGVGKSEVLKAVAKYDIYRMSCFAEPQRVLGVGAAESLGMILVSQNMNKARAKLYDPLRTSILQTPYFVREFMFDRKLEAAMEFPNGLLVKPGVTGEAAVHSEDVFWLGVTEANFLPVIVNSRKKRGIETLDVAEDLVEASILRMISRFQQGEGLLPMCRLILDSSRQYPDDFVERRTAQILRGELKHKAVVIERSQWEAKAGVRNHNGDLYFSGATFPVEVGSESRFSRILEPDEVPDARGRIVQVAVEMRSAFEQNIERALRDFAGVAVHSLHPLVADRKAIIECCRDEEQGYHQRECDHPFTKITTTFKDDVQFLIDQLIDPVARQPRVNPKYPRTCHVDVGLTGDCMGLAVGHAPRMTIVTRGIEGRALDLPCPQCNADKFIVCARCKGTGWSSQFGRKVRCCGCAKLGTVSCPSCRGTGRSGTPVARPSIYMDILLRIEPPTLMPIQFDDVEAFLKRLRDGGMTIPVVTADGTESAQFLQRQTSHYHAVVAEKLSMDTSKDPYKALANAVLDVDGSGRRRISYYTYQPFLTELAALEDQPQKIDHPSRGSKDVTDAAAGVVYNIERIPGLQAPAEGATLNVKRF